MNDLEQSYIEGFCKAAEAYGYNPKDLIEKSAQVAEVLKDLGPKIVKKVVRTGMKPLQKGGTMNKIKSFFGMGPSVKERVGRINEILRARSRNANRLLYRGDLSIDKSRLVDSLLDMRKSNARLAGQLSEQGNMIRSIGGIPPRPILFGS